MEQERGIGERDTVRSLRHYLEEIARYPRVTPDEERELATRIHDGEHAALIRLVEANLRFVVSYAKRYRGCGLPYLDLINEGNIGLLEAAKRFDPSREVKFITYAVWWVRQAIMQALASQGGVFRLPQKAAHLSNRVNKAAAELRSTLHREATDDEIAEHLSAPLEDVARLRRAAEGHVSLAALLDDEHDFRLMDKLEQRSTPAPDAALVEESLQRELRACLDELDSKERRILTLRYGLDGNEPQTLKQIGSHLGLSRERIRQIEMQVLGKLSESPRVQQLRSHLN